MSAVRQSLWISLLDSYLGLALRLASTVVIARLLTPREIGILAIAAVLSALASMFRDFGVAEYMIQEKNLTRQKIAACLTLNIIVSWAMAAAMYFGSGFAASFYSDPGVGEVMRVQALCFILVPFGAVTMAYFRRELNFRPVLICNILGNLTSFAVSIGLVLLGFSYMSLAWAALASLAVTVASSMWFKPRELPRWPGWTGIAEVFRFSKFASLVYLVGQIGKAAPDLIIGRALGMADVAMFSRGGGLVEMFQRLALRPVIFICMPYFARNDRETGEIASAYLKSVAYVTAVGWPFLAFMGIGAFAVIRIVYGPQWDAAVPVAQILVAAFAIELVHAMSREALLACGHARAANSLQFWMVVLQVAGLLVGVQAGIEGAAAGLAVATILGAVLAQSYLKRHLGLSTRKLLGTCQQSLWVTLIACAPAGIWAFAVGVTINNYIWFGVLGAMLTAVAWYAGLVLLNHPVKTEVQAVGKRLLDKLLRRSAA